MSAAHPAFAAALAQITGLHSAVSKAASCPVYRAPVGQRRGYLSLADAQAYVDGWRAYNDALPRPHQHKSPFGDGWDDAAHAEDMRLYPRRWDDAEGPEVEA